MKNSSWQFIDDQGTFIIANPQRLSRLYFPLCNEPGLISGITPDLHGDIKTGQNSFLLQPVSEFDLHNLKSKRDFWLYIERSGAFSLATPGQEDTSLEAGFLYHKMTRKIAKVHLETEITNFVPVSGEPVELMMVTVKNMSRKKLAITPTCAVPVYGRSADNLRDHRQVTSLLHRILVSRSAVTVTPTMSFDERGHKLNKISYVVQACTGAGALPVGAFPTVEEFIGEGGDLSQPGSMLHHLPPTAQNGATRAGKEAMGALQFASAILQPGKQLSYVVIMGITADPKDTKRWLKKFGSLEKFTQALKANQDYWRERLSQITFDTDNKKFNNWTKWVMLQPILRKIYGNSFLPDHDYGRGGRGWRDLWQDLLALILIHPGEARSSLVNNFAGVRIDGTNATIIGHRPGEFVADRNNITRVWMDHGTWPYLTLELYLHQTGDFEILLEEIFYFRDPQLMRAKHRDTAWTPQYGVQLKTKKGEVYWGSIIEHILVQHLVQFFNVGEHNHIRLEGADWNDGLDMAKERGESVAFTALYAGNMMKIAELLELFGQRKQISTISLAHELLILLDTINNSSHYNVISEKHKILDHYFAAVTPVISGKKKDVPIAALVKDLRAKAQWLHNHINENERLNIKGGASLYNGYYNNDGLRVEGEHSKGLRMTLPGQVFPIMGNVAQDEQIPQIFASIKKYLQDKDLGGFRLNTNFHELQLNLGRAFSFSYGDKENGAFFNHMCVMLAYSLYARGFAREGYEVLSSIYHMAADTARSKIYPGIPEYFNSAGRGMYHYLTGSASWFIATLLEEVFGVKGHFGDLLLNPKFSLAQINELGQISLTTTFAEKRIKVVYTNVRNLEYNKYSIQAITINGKKIDFRFIGKAAALISRSALLKHAAKKINHIEVILE
ncbi:MAG: cellobiose phosphorylase [Elusimicrobia bacterium]|nr:cellobiose phosphorylase [Elusimicrobiota bacterium]